MTGLPEQAPHFNRTVPIWAEEFSLNSREIVRVELGKVNGTPIVNLRRWFRPDGEPPRPTKKGLACALKHLPDIAALVNEALRRARGLGLLPSDGPDRCSEGGAPRTFDGVDAALDIIAADGDVR
jgi:hypothetical protein